jgi:hypothetical protein
MELFAKSPVTPVRDHNSPLPPEITPPSPPLKLRGGRVGLRGGAEGGGVKEGHTARIKKQKPRSAARMSAGAISRLILTIVNE